MLLSRLSVSYAPVVRVFHRRKQNHRISRIHERTLRVVYKDHSSSFDELLEQDNSCKIHDRNLQKVVAEILKSKMNLTPELMKEVFEIVDCLHARRNELKLKSRKICPVSYGIGTPCFAGAKFSNSFPSDLKECKSLEFFKSKIKNWIPETVLANFVNLTSNESATCEFLTECLIIIIIIIIIIFRGGSTSPAIPGM